MTATSFNALDRAPNVIYGRLPIPAERDEKIAGLLDTQLKIGNLAKLASEIRMDQRGILRCFAERAATLALRRQDEKLLKLGLIALCLGWPIEDYREGLLILPVLYHAARMLGMNPEQLFHEVGNLFGGEIETELTDFLERSDEDKSLEAMGYRLIHEPDGIRFKRTW